MESTPDLEIEGLSEDSTILISGPQMTGKFELLLTLLARTTDRLIVLSTKYGARNVVDQFSAITGNGEHRPAVIDCVANPDSASGLDDVSVRYVDSPQRLTRLGIEFTELVSEFRSDPDGGHVGVGIHSLTSMVMQTDVKQVYQFLQVFFGQTRGLDWLGLGVVDTVGVDDADTQLLQHHFDGLIETRTNDAGAREFRVRGLTPTISDWRSF